MIIASIIFFIILQYAGSNFVSIRGHEISQKIPFTLTTSWPVWTFEQDKVLSKVESPLEGEGWVNPSSYDSLYFPSDLPMPLTRPALGVVLANGVPRYIMPSLVMTLETPDKVWRNRGLCTLPRACSWIDQFSPYSIPLDRLRLSCFGRNSNNLKFLEDQDGNGAWNSLLEPTKSQFIGKNIASTSLKIDVDFNRFKNALNQYHDYYESLGLLEGYHFVDIPITTWETLASGSSSSFITLPQLQLKMYLSDLYDTKSLLEVEDPSYLDNETCGEMIINMKQVSAGGKSKYLPQVYESLFEAGSIMK
eukprot:gene14243-19111_t